MDNQTQFTFACPQCGQHLAAEPDMAGMELDCPGCGKTITVPPASAKEPTVAQGSTKALVPESANEAASNKPKAKLKAVKSENRATGGGKLDGAVIRDRMTEAIGIEKLQGFKLSELFSEVFSRHSQKEVEESFTVGTETSTPRIEDVDTSWPKPWLFVRMMAGSLLLFFLFWMGWNEFKNENLLPGLMIIGSFAVPISTLVLFIELNARKNISLYIVARLALLGGIFSLLLSLVLFRFLDWGWLGASMAGPIEETGKVLAMIAVARAAKYKYKLNGLLIGAAVGVGFAAFESAGYALRYFLSDVVQGTISFIVSNQSNNVNLAQFAGTLQGVPTMLNIIFVRGILSPMGHIVWSAIAGCALWRVIRGRAFSWSMLCDVNFIRLFLAPIALHMIWNSPLNIPFYGKYILVGIVGWFIALSLVQEGLRELREEQAQIKSVGKQQA